MQPKKIAAERRLKSALFASTALAGLAAAASPGLAQTDVGNAREDRPNPSVLEEIIITAQRRPERLQTVPVSVTALSGEAIERLNLTDSVDLAFQTPGLTYGTPVGEGNNPSITLRGVGLNDFNDNNESPVAVYQDEVYVASLAGHNFQMYDLERAEVLRGPQGTLFGRNASGGLMHFVTKRPTEDWDFTAQATYGRENLVEIESAVGGPVADNLRFRVSGAFRNHDGYVENRFDGGGDRNEADSIALRGQVAFDASERVTLLAKVEYADSDVLAPVYQHQGTGLNQQGELCSTQEALAGVCTDFFGFADNDGDPFAGSYDRKGPLSIETLTLAGYIQWRLSDTIELNSITAWSELDKLHEEDTDMSPFDFVLPTFIADNEQFTQEIRLNGRTDRLDWVFGGFFFDWDVNAPQILRFGEDLDPSFFLDTEVNQTSESWALFGRVDYRITPQLTVLAGLRWTTEEKEYDYVQVDRLGGVAGLPPGTVLLDFDEEAFGDLAVFDEDVFTGRIGINYEPAEGTFLFASISRGFKSGGFNAGFTSAPPERLKFDEETLISYEVGVKQALMGGRLRLNATAFFYDYSDRQTLSFANFGSFIGNADNTEVYGGELEIQGSPIRNLDINLGLSLLDTKADDVTLPDGSEVDGRELVLAPELSLNGIVRYSIPLAGNAGFVTPQIDFTYVSSHFFDIQNQPLAEEDGYSVWNASLAWISEDERYEIQAWGKNIFNKEYLVYTFDFTGAFGFNQLFFGRPAWWGITGTVRF